MLLEQGDDIITYVTTNYFRLCGRTPFSLPVQKQCRTIKTVTAAWEEYEVGPAGGLPCKVALQVTSNVEKKKSIRPIVSSRTGTQNGAATPGHDTTNADFPAYRKKVCLFKKGSLVTEMSGFTRYSVPDNDADFSRTRLAGLVTSAAAVEVSLPVATPARNREKGGQKTNCNPLESSKRATKCESQNLSCPGVGR
ncbi:hypothetical protein DFS34DRAFT_651837 [Phlyctochytrium arcticum]|nr:hypothetical protein DFS34DRAFT_651837 [Phlyctochytrium arcticum]